MSGGQVTENQLVVTGRKFEEVIDAFLFHQTRREMKVRLLILHAIIAGFEGSLNQVVDIDSGENLFQDVRHRHLLKDAALERLSEKPELGRDSQRIARHCLIAAS